MNFKNIILTILFGIFLLTFSKPNLIRWKNTDTILNKIGCRLYELNEINVNVDESIDIDKIVIKEKDRIVFSKGKQKSKIEQEYGHRILEIYLDNILIAEIGNFNRNNWFSNSYELNIYKRNTIEVQYKIIGPDASNDSFQKRFLRNSKGELFRIEYLNQSGEMYTFIEGKDLYQ